MGKKTLKSATAGQAARRQTKKTGSSTRDNILRQANEIISQTGVMDFRIEALATALHLSPGNITYHFPKKEDIISGIWEKYISETDFVEDQTISPLLDIKQLFLSYRTYAIKTLSYIGVVVHYYGDIGILINYNESNNARMDNHRKRVFESYDTLSRNGYMHPIDDPIVKNLTFEAQFLPYRWWLNHAMVHGDVDAVADKVDHYMAMAMFPLIPFLTPEGKKQMDSIMKIVKWDDHAIE